MVGGPSGAGQCVLSTPSGVGTKLGVDLIRRLHLRLLTGRPPRGHIEAHLSLAPIDEPGLMSLCRATVKSGIACTELDAGHVIG